MWKLTFNFSLLWPMFPLLMIELYIPTCTCNWLDGFLFFMIENNGFTFFKKEINNIF